MEEDADNSRKLRFEVDPGISYLKLNVGGELFLTTVSTLTKDANSMLAAMFRGKMNVVTDDKEWVRIDRSGKHFGVILNYLRDGYCPLPKNEHEIEEIMIEAKYYCLQELLEYCSEQLDKTKEQKSFDSVCTVLYPDSKEQAENLWTLANRPVVKLIINRHNNKYSYTNTSDENLLKNLDLFDKLSLKFKNRVLFLKDIVSSNEICCWSFYGPEKKEAEICCTSIVYATDKKHTKVEFPEARIYEELLNILLYENVTIGEMGSRPSKANSILSNLSLTDQDQSR